MLLRNELILHLLNIRVTISQQELSVIQLLFDCNLLLSDFVDLRLQLALLDAQIPFHIKFVVLQLLNLDVHVL